MRLGIIPKLKSAPKSDNYRLENYDEIMGGQAGAISKLPKKLGVKIVKRNPDLNEEGIKKFDEQVKTGVQNGTLRILEGGVIVVN